jgi:hypothetical protein
MASGLPTLRRPQTVDLLGFAQFFLLFLKKKKKKKRLEEKEKERQNFDGRHTRKEKT